jgi:hypothetical protein
VFVEPQASTVATPQAAERRLAFLERFAPLCGRALRTDRHGSPHYFVTIRLGGVLGVGAGGEIVNVTQVFQLCGRFSAANSL